MRSGTDAPPCAKGIGLADAIRCIIGVWLETEGFVLVAFGEEFVWSVV
jgi:hypothetical protein